MWAGLEEAQVVANDLSALHQVASLMQWHRDKCTNREIVWVRLERDRGMSFSAECHVQEGEEDDLLSNALTPIVFDDGAPMT